MAPTLRADLDVNLQKFKHGMGEALSLAKAQGEKIEKVFGDLNPKVNSKILIGGVAGFAAGFGLDKALDLLVSMNRQMVELADNAKKAKLSTDRFQELRLGANMDGVSDATFAADIKDLAKRLDEAASKENDLRKMLEINNIKYKERNGEVISINKALGIAADLVRNARSEFDKTKIAGAFGLSSDWVKALEQGQEKFMETAAAARGAGVVIDEATIEKAKKFTQEWDRSAVRWSASMRASALAILPLMNRLVEKAASLLEIAGRVPAILGAGMRGLAGGFEGFNLQDLEMFERDTVADLERLRTLPDSLKFLEKPGQVEGLEEALSRLRARIAELRQESGKPIPRITVTPPAGGFTKLPGGDEESGKRDFFARQVDSLNKRAAALAADTLAVGTNAAMHERLRAELALLQAVQRDGGEVTNEQIEKYTLLRATMGAQQALAGAGIELNERHADSFTKVSLRVGQAAGQLDSAKIRFQGVNDAAKFFGNQMVDSIDRAIEGTFKFNDVLRSLRQELLRALITGEGLFAKLLGLASTTGGTGGFFGLFANIGGRASGGAVRPGRAYMVGERGPEPFIPTSPGTIIPNDAMRMMGGGVMNISIPVSINAPGADPAQLARVQRSVEDLQRTLPQQIAAANRAVRVRGVSP